ncbi:hypothetical protein ASG05_11270 [Frigoribacterium sp. Leaf186]|nr:hypothetical protein ASG05_11270 [Frigoribacterium sp. Leaf186]
MVVARDLDGCGLGEERSLKGRPRDDALTAVPPDLDGASAVEGSLRARSPDGRTASDPAARRRPHAEEARDEDVDLRLTADQRCWCPSKLWPSATNPRSLSSVVKRINIVGCARTSSTASASSVGRDGVAPRSQQCDWTIWPPTSAQPRGRRACSSNRACQASA